MVMVAISVEYDNWPARLQPVGLKLCNVSVTFFPFLLSSFFKQSFVAKRSRKLQDHLHQIFRSGRHVGVDVQSGIGFRISQGTLPWQPILGAKSAEINDTPSFLGLAFHNGLQDGKVDGCVNSAEVLPTSCKNLVNYGPLTLEFTVMVW